MATASLLVATVVASGPAVARAQAAGAVIATSAFDPSPAAPDALAVADVLVENRGLGSSGTPVELTVATPGGVTVEALTTGGGHGWTCNAAGAATTCTLMDDRTGTPAALEGEDVIDGHLTLALDPSVAVGAGLAVGLSVVVPGEGDVAPDLTEAETTLVFPPLPAGQALSLDVVDDFVDVLVAGRNTAVTTRIRNLGPGALGGADAPTTLTGILPPVPTPWTARGTDWSCVDDAGRPACTWSGPAVAAGSSLPDLVVDHVAPTTLTGEGQPLAWTRTVAATPASGGSNAVVLTDFTATVVAAGQPEVGITTTGANPPSLEPPGRVDIGVTVSGLHLRNPAEDVVLSAELPGGFEFASLTSDDPWRCDPGRAAVRCQRPADFGEEPSSDVIVHLDAGQAAAAGAAPIVLVAAATGEPEDRLTDNAAMVVVQVAKPPPAATALRLWQYDGAGVAAPTDGSPYRLVPGVPGTVGIDAVNDGSGAIDAGTGFVLTAVLPEDTRVAPATDQGAPEWRCTTNGRDGRTVLECSLTLTDPVALDAALPRLRAGLTLPPGSPAGDLVIPVTLAPVDPAASSQLHSSVDVPVVVADPAPARSGPDLTIDATVVPTPRILGRNGRVSIEIENTGVDEIKKADVGIDLPRGVSVPKEHPSGCKTKGGRWKDFELVCEIGKKVAPGQRFDPVHLDVVASPGASPGGDLLVVVDPHGKGANVETTVGLTVLPALVARGSPTPSAVHNQAFGAMQPTVLLDGRASDALGADHVWRHVPERGEPLIHFDGAAVDAREIRSPTASFRAPVVDETTQLHFVLDVTDGFTTSTGAVVVTVEPVPVVDDDGPTGWEDEQSAGTASVAADAFASATAAGAEPWWTWTRDPAVRLNNFDPPRPTPVRGSRLTLLDNGEYTFAEPGDPPETVEVRHEWLRCDVSGASYDPGSCSVVGTEQSVVPQENGSFAVLRMIIRGERRGEILETVREFELGEVAVDYGRPASLSPPRILGEPAVGKVLTGDPGTWTMEHRLAFQWMRCPDPPEFPFCFDIDGQTGDTYTVTARDIGHLLRLEITSFSLEAGDDGVAESDFFGPIPDDGSADPLEVATDLPGGTTSVPNSASITVHASSTGGRGPVIFRWDQTAGPPVLDGPSSGPALSFTTPADGSGDLQFVVTATDTSGDTATAGITVTYGEVPVPGVLCELLNEARAAGPDPVVFALGSAIVLTFASATTGDGACSESTTLDMRGATVDLFGWFRVTGLEVHVDSGGIDLMGGTLTAAGDDVLAGMNFRLVTTGMHIPFDRSGDSFHVAGAVIAAGLPFLHLPAGWEAAARFSFSSSAGEQAIGFDAVAWDGTAGTAQPVHDNLPVPPDGAPQLSLVGSARTDRSFSFSLAATDLVEIRDVGIDFAGTVARDAAGVFAIVTSGSLASPVGLAPGIRLETAALGWDGTRFTGSGSLAITANGGSLVVAAGFDFADARHWAATLSVRPGAGSPSWTPVDGFKITDPRVEGSIRRQGATTTYDIEIGAPRVTLGPDVVLEDVLFVLHVGCNATCATVLSLSGAATVSVADPPTTVAIDGTLDLGTGAFSFTAAIAELRPFDGLVVENLTLAMTGGGGRSTELSIEGDAVVFDIPVEVVISESDLGFFLSIALGDWDPAAGAPTFGDARIVYSSYPTTVTVGSETVPLPARSVHLTASTRAPRWFVDLTGFDPGRTTVVGRVSLATRDFNVEVSFGVPADTELFDVGGVSLDLGPVGFLVDSTAGRITTSLRADATLGVPAFKAGAAPGAVAVTLAATYRPGPTGGLVGTVTAVGEWTGAFGVPGLTVRDLTVGVSIGGTASQLQLAGIVTLPADWAGSIGIVPGTPIALVASVGGPNACFGLEVGQAGATERVVDIGGAGALTARHLSIVVAPTGCTVGVHTLAPGMSLFFDGAVLGTDVTVNATLTPTPFEFDATVTIGQITVDGFRLEQARLHVLLSQIRRGVSFQAQAAVMGVSAAASGSFTSTPTGTTVDLAGTFSAPELGGFALDRLAMTLHLEQRARAVTIAASAEADFDVLGAPQHAAFAFRLVNGRLDAASGDASVVIPIDHLTVTGSGHFEFERGRFPTISITGTVDVDGHSLTRLSGTLTRGGLDLEARLGTALGFASAPTLHGTIAWASDGTSTITIEDHNGNEVAASPGDFRFSAENVGFSASGFLLMVDVSIGFVDGVSWADLATSINLGSGHVEVSGSFASNGDFGIRGSAALDLAGFDLPEGSFSVVRAGGAVDVRGDVTWSVPKLARVRFQGSFTRSPGSGVTYELRGSGVVNPGGHRFGTGEFEIYRTPGGSSGVTAVAQVDVPGFAAGSASLSVATDQTLRFHVRLEMRETIGRVLGSPTVDVRYYNGPEVVLTGFTLVRDGFFWRMEATSQTVQVDRLSMSTRAHRVLGLPGSVQVSGTVARSPGGAYAYSLQVSGGFSDSGSKKLGVCRASYSVDTGFSGSISGSANSLSIDTDASTSVGARCGRLRASASTTFTFRYDSPATFGVKLKLVLRFGELRWKPTVYSF